jgi:hypothetical protein
MGEARHEGVGILFGAGQKGILKRAQLPDGVIDLIANPQTEIRRHLVVARPGGMQAPSDRSNQFAQTRFDIHVDVFEFSPEWEGPRLDLTGYGIQPIQDDFGIFGIYDTLLGKHGGMRLRASKVLLPKAFIDIDGDIDGLHNLIGSGTETSTPHFLPRAFCLRGLNGWALIGGMIGHDGT